MSDKLAGIGVKDLEDGYSIFGNKGNVLNNDCHIQVVGGLGSAITLCGVPMLSTNHAIIEGVEDIHCQPCLKVYYDKFATRPTLTPVTITGYNDEPISSGEFESELVDAIMFLDEHRVAEIISNHIDYRTMRAILNDINAEAADTDDED